MRVTRQARWFYLEWLAKGEVQGDALLDLKTTQNKLSVYEVGNGSEEDRIIVALAANREFTDNLDYAIFDGTVLAAINVSITKQDGKTPDRLVDKLHYDLTNLTARKLALLAHAVSLGRHDRKGKKEIEQRIREGISTGILDRTKVKAKLLQRLGI